MTKNTETSERERRGPTGGSSSAPVPGAMPECEQENGTLWLSENGAALKSSNEFVAAHGVPLAKHRQF